MVGGRSEHGSRRAARAASVVVPFPRGASGDRLDIARFVPSGRSLLVACAVLVGAFGAYWLALVTPLFAVQRVEVRGASPDIERQVRAAARDTLGTSLVSVDAADVAAKVRSLPMVAAVSVDRAFPHTLVLRVAEERPVAVARRRTKAWLVTGSGKVIRETTPISDRDLPRIWLARTVPVALDVRLPAPYLSGARALAAARAAGLAVKGLRMESGELTLALRSEVDVRLGPDRDLGLKVAVAKRVVRVVGPDIGYVDVSVPERPIAG